MTSRAWGRDGGDEGQDAPTHLKTYQTMKNQAKIFALAAATVMGTLSSEAIVVSTFSVDMLGDFQPDVLTVTDIAESLFVHPTLAEVLSEAAE